MYFIKQKQKLKYITKGPSFFIQSHKYHNNFPLFILCFALFFFLQKHKVYNILLYIKCMYLLMGRIPIYSYIQYIPTTCYKLYNVYI